MEASTFPFGEQTPLRGAIASKTPLPATSTKRKRLGTIQAPEFRIFKDAVTEQLHSPLKAEKRPNLREFSTQTSPHASDHATATAPALSLQALSGGLSPAPAESRRVSYGGRVREALQVLAKACTQQPQAPVSSGSLLSELPGEVDDGTVAPLLAASGPATAAHTPARPVECHSMASSPFAAATTASCGTLTSPAANISSATMTTPHATTSIATHTSPLTMTAAETMTSPAPTHDTGTLTSPPAAAAALMSLVAQASPRTLKEQIETLAIGNELLRDHQVQLQASLDGAAGREAVLRQAADQSRRELQHCVQQAAVEMDELCAGLQQRDDEIVRLNSLLGQAPAPSGRGRSPSPGPTHGLAPEEFARLEYCEKELLALRGQVEQLQGSLQAATDQAVQARAGEARCAERAQAEASRAEQLARVNKMLQDDLRMTYNKQRQELAALQRTYQHDNYQARYQALLGQLQTVAAREAGMVQLTPVLDELRVLEAQAGESLEVVVAALEMRSQQMMEANARMEDRVAAAEAEAAACKEEMLLARQQCEEYRNALSEQQQTMDLLQQQCDGMSGLTQETKSLMEQMEQAMAAKESQLSEAAQEQETLRMAIEELESTLKAKEESIVQLRSDLDLLEEQQAMQDEAAACKTSDAVKLDLDALKAVISQRDDCIAKLTEQIDEQARQHAELRDFIAEERLVRQEVMDDGERELAALRLKCTATQEELTSVRLQLETQKSQHEQELQALRTQSELQQSDTSLESLHAQTALAQLGGELVEKELQLYEARAGLAPMQAQLDQARARVGQLEASLVEREKEVTHVKDYLKQFQERSQEKIATLQSNLATAEAEVQALDEELARVMRQQAL